MTDPRKVAEIKQPEALRLADLLLSENAMDCLEHSDDAATELRRLHEENELLRQALAQQEQNELLKQGWRQCAVGQRTTQYCGMAQQAYLDGVNSGIEAEREACAKVCDEIGMLGNGELGQFWSEKCADAIRARGEK